MLNFGHLRQEPSPECSEDPGPPVSSGQAKRLTRRRGQPNALPRSTDRTFFFVSRDIPGTFPAPSAPLSGPRCLRRSAGHSGRACCPEIESPPRQTVVFRFYHNFRKNTNPNPSPCRNAGSAQAFSHRAPHKRPAENPGRFERGSILAQSSLGLIHSFSARPCIILTAA